MPLSRDPDGRGRQLANLRPAPPAPPGNALALRHRGYATIARERLDEKLLEVFDALAVDAPLRGPTGELPAADVAQVRLLAECLCRLEDVSANVRDFGMFEQRGKRRSQVRPAVELEGRLRREAADYLNALGMTPKSRARLGLDLQRGFDLAQHWASEGSDDADLAAARESLAAFADMAGRPLEPWQARALELEAPITVVVAPRQSGKSLSLVVLALWWAFRRRGQRVLLVSAGEEASRRLLADVRRIALRSRLLAGSVVDEQAGLVTLSNGSEVRSVPASERAVRGWTVDLLLVDEAAMVPDDLLLGAAFPTTAARPDARIVLASSATVASGAFYDHAVRGEQGSEHVRTHRWALGAVERLGELRAEVDRLRTRSRELEAERREVSRSLDRAKGPWLAYLEAVEAGEDEADAEREAELVAAIRDAEAAVTMRVVDDEVSVVSERLEAQIAGNHRALEEAEAAVARFIRDHFDDLAAGLAVDSQAASERMVAAWAELREAERGWYAALSPWRPLLEAVGMDAAAETPEHPLKGLEPAVEQRVATPPMPLSLRPEGGDGEQ